MRGTVELPEPAREKLLALQLATDAALDAGRSAAARLNSLPRDAADAMRERLAGERDRHNSKHQQLSRLLNAAKQWIASLRSGTVVEVAPVTEVVDFTNGDALTMVNGARAEIARLKAQLASVRNASLPISDLKQLAQDYVVELVRRGKPRIGIVGDQLKVQWRGDTVLVEDTAALLGWLAPDQMLRRIEYELDQLPAREGALSADARIERVAELEAKIFQVELQEAALLERAGIDSVLPRPDMSPPAYLGVTIAPALAQEVA
jgi:hypothetical protein